MDNNQRDALVIGPLWSFKEVDEAGIPRSAAGVYSVWDSDGDLVYVGMSGRGATSDRIAEMAMTGRAFGLLQRLRSHASGRRSGDQFCVYVCDRLLLPTLDRATIERVARGEQSLDVLTRDWIQRQLSFRYVVVPNGVTAFEVEHAACSGGLGAVPALNPRGTGA